MTGKRVVPLFIVLAALTVLPSAVRSGEDPSSEKKKFDVVLLDAGSEPRQLLRYGFKAEGKEVLQMDMAMTMSMSLMGQMANEMVIPTMIMVMEIENESVSAEGDLKYKFKMTKADVEESADSMPGVAEAMRAGMQNVVGMHGWAVVTPRGETTDAEFNLPEGMDPSISQTMDSVKQQMDQMSAALPLEPVGIGAKWKVNMPVEAQGMNLHQVIVYELVQMLGNTATLKMTIEQKAERQMMDLPNLPAGTTAELLSLKSNGTGTMELNLSKIVPQGEMSLEMSMKAVIRAGAEEVPMAMDMDLKVTMEPQAVTESPKDEDD